MLNSDATERLSAEDAVFFYLDTKDMPLHIASVMVFDGPIPLEGLRDLIQSKLPLVPALSAAHHCPSLQCRPSGLGAGSRVRYPQSHPLRAPQARYGRRTPGSGGADSERDDGPRQTALGHDAGGWPEEWLRSDRSLACIIALSMASRASGCSMHSSIPPPQRPSEHPAPGPSSAAGRRDLARRCPAQLLRGNVRPCSLHAIGGAQYRRGSGRAGASRAQPVAPVCAGTSGLGRPAAVQQAMSGPQETRLD